MTLKELKKAIAELPVEFDELPVSYIDLGGHETPAAYPEKNLQGAVIAIAISGA